MINRTDWAVTVFLSQYRRHSRVRPPRAPGEPLPQRQPGNQGAVGGRAAAGAARGPGHLPGRGDHLRLRGPLEGVAAASSLARALTWVRVGR